MDECITILRKDCSLDVDPKADVLPSQGLSEDWTLFQNAFRLMQICGKNHYSNSFCEYCVSQCLGDSRLIGN